MSRQITPRALLHMTVAAAVCAGCSKPPSEHVSESPSEESEAIAKVAPPPPFEPDVMALLEEFAGAVVAAAAPIPGDAPRQARDRAGVRLSRHASVLDNTAPEVLWTDAPGDRASDLDLRPSIAIAREVWTRSFLSCFELHRPWTIRREGELAIIEMPASARPGLEPSDYPYPIWHSAAVWNIWQNPASVRFVFQDRMMIASQVVARAGADRNRAPTPHWDGRWTWADDRGQPQPRASQIAYVLSPDNPHTRTLDRAYQRLATHFETRGCMACHQPDNHAEARTVYLLGFPALAIAARSAILDALDPAGKPAAGSTACTRRSLAVGEDADELRRLAARFDEECVNAFDYESIYTIRPEEYPDRPTGLLPDLPPPR